MKKPLQFSDETRVYRFRGLELPPMKPGSYDASKWTPPTHQQFAVEIQSDGMWSITLRQVRNIIGPSGLAKMHPPLKPEEE